MDPTTTQIELLREVIDGKKIFAPKSDSVDDINSFQVEAEELIELGEKNLLTGCRPKRESYTGKQQIVRVLVAGVTAEGRRFVQSLAATKPRDDAGSVTCPKCNLALRASARFCDDCGFALQSVLDSTLLMSPPLPSTPSDSFVGVVLQGKYEVISEIGRGGMGRVYRARHRRLGKEVAIKVIDKKFVSDLNFVERFLREARAAASLKHSNIIDILDIDETPEPDPRPYIVMEFIDGKSLKEILADEEKLTVDRTVALFVEICKALSFAHQHGVIHRDLKPDNIMIIRGNAESGEKIKVLDFGLAKMRESDDQPVITQVGMVMGTPPYMSPEQCRGEELDARSDVYSLATIIFEMISGAPPFSGSGSNVYSKHQFEAVPAFDTSLDIPMEIVAVVNRGLAKNREDRPVDAQAFSLALQNAYADRSEIPAKAPQEQRAQKQKAAPGEERTLIPGLTRIDTLTLKISYELALETGDPDIIHTSKLLEALRQLGIAENEVWESLELLNERRFIDARRIRGEGRSFQVYSLELQGFHEYAKVFISDYNALIERVIHAIGVDEQKENLTISEALGQPILVINFILDLLENNGMLTQHKQLGGKSIISVVTVDLKREARETDAQQPEVLATKPSTNASVVLVPVIESYRTSADNFGEIDYYAFRISLRNISDKTIRNFRLEVEIPSEYADPTHQSSMSENIRRVRDTVTVYRHTQEQFPGFVIYPNDVSSILMNTNYQMRLDQYRLASGTIKVTVYIDDKLAGSEQFSIADNRNKDRMEQLGLSLPGNP